MSVIVSDRLYTQLGSQLIHNPLVVIDVCVVCAGQAIILSLLSYTTIVACSRSSSSVTFRLNVNGTATISSDGLALSISGAVVSIVKVLVLDEMFHAWSYAYTVRLYVPSSNVVVILLLVVFV